MRSFLLWKFCERWTQAVCVLPPVSFLILPWFGFLYLNFSFFWKNKRDVPKNFALDFWTIMLQQYGFRFWLFFSSFKKKNSFLLPKSMLHFSLLYPNPHPNLPLRYYLFLYKVFHHFFFNLLIFTGFFHLLSYLYFWLLLFMLCKSQLNDLLPFYLFQLILRQIL